jgi:glycosyltransferase involved in cell wall biosynthesis
MLQQDQRRRDASEAGALPAAGPHDAVALPPVAVVVGCFNQARYIETAIRSVAAQSHESFECVVVDDRSSDESVARIRACLDEIGDRRFRLIPRGENGGQMAAMLTGLDATTAPFVAFLDGDDVWGSEFLARHVEAHLCAADVAAISTSDAALIDRAGSLIAAFNPLFRRHDPRREGAEDIVRCVVGEGEDTLVFVARGFAEWLWSTTSGMVFRRDALEAIRPDRPGDIRISADLYLAFGAHFLGGTVRLERVLGAYRLHGANAWAAKRFLGDAASIGVGTSADEAASRFAVIAVIAQRAKEMQKLVPRRYLRSEIISYLGWEGALAFCRSDPAAHELLGRWAKPRRKLIVTLARLLPTRFFLPTHLQPPPEWMPWH